MSGWGMSFFGGGGSGGASKKKDAPKNAILQLRSTLDMLAKREKHLQTQMDEQDGLARKFVSTNKNAAKTALRRKKEYEHRLEQTSAQMMTVEREIASIETANINKETLDAMKNASAAMKQIHGGLTIDKVDQTMEDLRDQHAIGEEIAEALKQGTTMTGVDEEDLDEELTQIQQEVLDQNLLETGTVPVKTLPNAGQTERIHNQPDKQPMLTPSPAKAPAKHREEEEEDEEEELRKLQAEMAM